MSARPIASFAAAASGTSQNPNVSSAVLSNAPSMDPTAPSIVPRAIIPAMEEIGLGSGVGSDGGFDLSSAPLQPSEQRVAFEPGPAFGAPTAAAAPPPPHCAAHFAA